MHIFFFPPSHPKRKAGRTLILEMVFQQTKKKKKNPLQSDEVEAGRARNEGSELGKRRKMTFNRFLFINPYFPGLNVTKGAVHRGGSALTNADKSSGLNCSVSLAECRSADATRCKLMPPQNCFASSFTY